MADKWIIEPFNGVFFALFAFFLALLIVSSILLKKKSEQTRRLVLSGAMILTLVLFVFYKIALFLDKDYSEITAAAGLGAFSWWKELPLQLCNINTILIPISVMKKNRNLMGFAFFLGPIGALMALIMPCLGFSGYPIYLFRNLGYYITHFMVFTGGIAVGAYGLYRPTYKDILPVTLTALIVSFSVFLFNMFLRLTHIEDHANYFYSVETEGNAILDLFHSWIPVPFLYLLPCCFLIMLPYMLIETTCFYLADKKKKKA